MNRAPHRRSALYGEADTRKGGGIEHAGSFGTNIAIRSTAPPHAAEYDAYVISGNRPLRRSLHFNNVTGTRLRRAVIMRREGSSWKECAESVGLSSATLRTWLEFLPLHLAV